MLELIIKGVLEISTLVPFEPQDPQDGSITMTSRVSEPDESSLAMFDAAHDKIANLVRALEVTSIKREGRLVTINVVSRNTILFDAFITKMLDFSIPVGKGNLVLDFE